MKKLIQKNESLLVHRRQFKSIGTTIDLQIVLENDKSEQIAHADQTFQEAISLYNQFDQELSRFKSNSLVNQINKNLGQWQTVSPQIIHLSQMALEFNQKSAGLFDPRILDNLEKIGYGKTFWSEDFPHQPKVENLETFTTPLSQDLLIDQRKSRIQLNHRLDFTGIAKGFINDRIFDKFIADGWKNFLVNSGGDLRVHGHNPHRSTWKIDLEEFNNRQYLLQISNQALATSGITRRKWQTPSGTAYHIINPQNPTHFPLDLRTVSVIAPNTVEADAWAKILFLNGIDLGLKIADKLKIPAFFLSRKGNLIVSSKAKNSLVKILT